MNPIDYEEYRRIISYQSNKKRTKPRNYSDVKKPCNCGKNANISLPNPLNH